MEYIKTTEELQKLDLHNCYTRHGVIDRAFNKMLVGKPVIAAFLGISDKTLKRYLNESHKCHDIPVQRGQHRCIAITNDLLIWSINSELNKLDSALVEKAGYIAAAEFLRISFEHYMKHYVYASQCRVETNNRRLRTRCYYAKTVNKAVNLIKLKSKLLSNNLTLITI